MRILPPSLFHRGPFSAAIQTRFKKHANTAQTRLETRTPDPKLDSLAFHRNRLELVLRLHTLFLAKKRFPFVSVQILSRCSNHAGIDTLSAGGLLRKYPHVFQVFAHPVRQNACFKFTHKFVELLRKEDEVVCGMNDANVIKIKKILSMSVNGRVHIHAIRLMRRELGLPENFKDSIVELHSEIFRMVGLEIVELVDTNESGGRLNFVAEIEKWRHKEYIEKWFSEFEIKYSFPIHFPTGFRIAPGFREKLKNWQRLWYVKPYERMENVRIRSCGGLERYEKRAVGIIHELLCLTVEKMVAVERLVHFRKDLGIEVNLRELLLKHPGIFYISTRGNTQIAFLREGYSRGRLVEPNPIYDARRKMFELIMLGSRNTSELRVQVEAEEERKDARNNKKNSETQSGDFVIPILESFRQQCDKDIIAHPSCLCLKDLSE
ncbi:protein ROOT PRIMORDIUM DEFECTIVE 1 [Primulina eburnea]|uniref:protein ROOT PRIMORDIUM DEFECTIVE 1 n=1 Tax=Primulina eburnea TaxID=1245227 RepID=UPI003C6CB740